MNIERFVGVNRFLSNFYLSPILYQEVEYISLEHAYQSAKTHVPVEKIAIMLAPSATAAKRLGRVCTLRIDWDSIKLSVMEQLLRLKFSDPLLKSKLVKTYPQELIEGNYWNDYYWGVCQGKGENHLGKLLMKIREEIIVK